MGAIAALLGVLIASSVHAAEDGGVFARERAEEEALFALQGRHPAVRKGELFLYATPERSKQAVPARFHALPILGAISDPARAPPVFHVVDGLCLGDPTVQARWLDAVRAEAAKTRDDETLLDMASTWAVDDCEQPTLCRFAAAQAVTEKKRRVAEHLWEVGTQCADPSLTPLYEKSAPSEWIVQHLWRLQVEPLPTKWSKRYEKLIPDALGQASRSVKAGYEPSWFRVSHAAQVVASIDDPAARKALFTAHAGVKSRDAKDAIGTGFAFMRNEPRAEELFKKACENKAQAETCDRIRSDRSWPKYGDEPITERITYEEFDAPAWASTENRRAELLALLQACEHSSCERHLAALDWKAARARSKALREARIKQHGAELVGWTAMDRTLERFESRDALVADLKKSGLLPADAIAHPTDVTARDLLLRNRLALSFDLDDTSESWPPANDHVLRMSLARLAGIRDAYVLQTVGKRHPVHGVARFELSVWLDGEVLREPFLGHAGGFNMLAVVALMNTLLETRKSSLRAAMIDNDEIAIGPKEALATAGRDGLLDLFFVPEEEEKEAEDEDDAE